MLLLEIHYDIEKMHITSHLHVSNTVLIHSSYSSFTYVSLLTG